MTGIAVQLARLGPDHTVDMVHQLQGHVHERPLAGGPVIGHGGLDHVARHIQLVVVLQIRPAPVQSVDDVIGIQVAIGLLGVGDRLDRAVRQGFKVRIGMPAQAVRHALQPLGQVAVLEHKAAKASFFLARGHPVIAHAIAGLRVLHGVVQRPPLVGDALPRHRVAEGRPESGADGRATQDHSTAVHISILRLIGSLKALVVQAEHRRSALKGNVHYVAVPVGVI